jgi:hypothetical protein
VGKKVGRRVMTINWHDPAERFALIEGVGVAEYTRQHAEHMAKHVAEHVAEHVVETVNGHAIRVVYSERFGKLYYMVGDIGHAATLEGAREIARSH